MRASFPIEQLCVAHWPRDPGPLPPVASHELLVIETCLRRLVVGRRVALPTTGARPPELRSGPAAYRLLLEVTTGLLSAIPGETNVFGQFRRAWEAHRRSSPHAAALLEPLITRLVRDTRMIRQRHLQGIGGASYGPLVRRLLRVREGERVLFVGAGELARSMLPFFATLEIGTWNRTQPGPAFTAAGRIFAPADGAAAADWANHAVLTTPADAANDRLWADWLGASLVQTVVHLGHRREVASPLSAHATVYDLDDVFELRRSQDKVRSLQLERARQECGAVARQLAAAGDIGAPAQRLATG